MLSNMSPGDLISCCIIEKDVNDETLVVWAFPSITLKKRQYLLRKFQGINSQTQFFAFSHYLKEWCYINKSPINLADNLPQVKEFALVVMARDYNPTKYENLCQVLCKKYGKTGNPAEVLQLYLSAMIKGVWKNEGNETFSLADFESKKNVGNTEMKELIKLCGLEIILVYTSLLLRKRLIVYHHSLDSLLKWIYIIPFLMVHRNYKETTFPWVNLESDELLELKSCNSYIAGSVDKGIEALNEIYDVFLNIPAREVSISPYSKDYFVMTKTHKDIALFIVQLSENPNLEEYQIVEEIAKKTQELLTQLRFLASHPSADESKLNLKSASIEALKEKNLAPALENFLINLLMAEKINNF